MKWDATEPSQGHVHATAPPTRSSPTPRRTGSGCAATPWSGTRSSPAGRRACPARALRNAMVNHITQVADPLQGQDLRVGRGERGVRRRRRRRAARLEPAAHRQRLDRGRVPHRPGRRPGRQALLQRLQHRRDQREDARRLQHGRGTSSPAACRSTASASSRTSARLGRPATTRPTCSASPTSAWTCRSPSWTSPAPNQATAYTNVGQGLPGRVPLHRHHRVGHPRQRLLAQRRATRCCSTAAATRRPPTPPPSTPSTAADPTRNPPVSPPVSSPPPPARSRRTRRRGCTATVSVNQWQAGSSPPSGSPPAPTALNAWAVTAAAAVRRHRDQRVEHDPSGSSGTVRFSNVAYNGRISAGQYTEFGFQATGTGRHVPELRRTVDRHPRSPGRSIRSTGHRSRRYAIVPDRHGGGNCSR